MLRQFTRDIATPHSPNRGGERKVDFGQQFDESMCPHVGLSLVALSCYSSRDKPGFLS